MSECMIDKGQDCPICGVKIDEFHAGDCSRESENFKPVVADPIAQKNFAELAARVGSSRNARRLVKKQMKKRLWGLR